MLTVGLLLREMPAREAAAAAFAQNQMLAMWHRSCCVSQKAFIVIQTLFCACGVE